MPRFSSPCPLQCKCINRIICNLLYAVTNIAASADETDYVLHENPGRVPPGSSKATGRSAVFFLKIMAKKF